MLASGAACAAAGLLVASVALVSVGMAGAAVVAWVCTTESFGMRSVGANFGLVFSGFSIGLLVGAASSAAIVGSALARSVPVSATTATALAFALDLMLAVFVAARVRPLASLGVVMGARRRGRD
jgi:hypothetical protein